MATKKKVTNKEVQEQLNKLYETKGYKNWDEIGVDNDPGIDVPLHARGGEWKWNFEEKPMSTVDKVTWVLTAVNVGILLSIILENI